MDSHLPLGGIYALSPFLFIYFFLIARKNIAKTWPRSGEKGDQNTIKKSLFALLIFYLKKKEEEEEEEEESKKERKKEKNRKEKKRKEKSIALF